MSTPPASSGEREAPPADVLAAYAGWTPDQVAAYGPAIEVAVAYAAKDPAYERPGHRPASR
ncbi:hypothetical protein [Nonomuraea gerenzanensis]|uniref:hypothetical protein n=1 Tax=Nonomuraea gerenzanensis TaxID=93944 RepID=UPI001CDA25F1|nr:hypothetical protein [Nonomuraea gerenzanensis]UBU09056.1 hypothetical protein LCN96_32310 [Nonomuraea gerenzanensis]